MGLFNDSAILFLILDKNYHHSTICYENALTIIIHHHESLNTLKSELTRATNLTVRLAKPGLQYVIICDVSFLSTGFVVMIEDYLIDQNGKEKKTYEPVFFWLQTFDPYASEVFRGLENSWHRIFPENIFLA